MITVNLKNNVQEVLLGLKREAEQIEFSMVVALTQTAQEVKRAEVAEMKRVFRRVSRYSLNSMRVMPATKASKASRVYVKDDAVRFINPNIDGGVRPYKRMEKALMATGRMPRNTNAVPAAGDTVSAGEVMKILSALMSAEMTSGYSANRTATSKRRNKSLNEYVSFKEPWGRLRPGVYKRIGGNKLHAIFFYVRRAQYKRRFDFYGVAQRTVDEAFPRLLKAAREKYPSR